MQKTVSILKSRHGFRQSVNRERAGQRFFKFHMPVTDSKSENFAVVSILRHGFQVFLRIAFIHYFVIANATVLFKELAHLRNGGFDFDLAFHIEFLAPS